MVHFPCFYLPLLILLCSPFQPSWPLFYLLRTLLAVTGSVHFGLRLLVNWPPLSHPFPKPSPLQIPWTPITQRLTKTTSGIIRHLLSGTICYAYIWYPCTFSPFLHLLSEQTLATFSIWTVSWDFPLFIKGTFSTLSPYSLPKTCPNIVLLVKNSKLGEVLDPKTMFRLIVSVKKLIRRERKFNKSAGVALIAEEGRGEPCPAYMLTGVCDFVKQS